MQDDAQPLPCHEKLVFDTLKQANATAVVVAHRYGTKVSAYRCRYCHLWHVSSNTTD